MTSTTSKVQALYPSTTITPDTCWSQRNHWDMGQCPGGSIAVLDSCQGSLCQDTNHAEGYLANRLASQQETFVPYVGLFYLTPSRYAHAASKQFEVTAPFLGDDDAVKRSSRYRRLFICHTLPFNNIPSQRCLALDTAISRDHCTLDIWVRRTLPPHVPN